MSTALSTIIKSVRETGERAVRELLSMARKSRSSSVRGFAYSLVPEELVTQEVTRGLLRAMDRIDDLYYEYKLVESVSTYQAEEKVKELEMALLKFEELYVLHRERLRRLEELTSNLDIPPAKEVVDTLIGIEKRIIENLDNIIGTIRAKLKEES